MKILFYLLFSFSLFLLASCNYSEEEKVNLDQAAMKRILGEDKDNNGVRDDVDAYILTLTNDIDMKKAYIQYAKDIQKDLTISTKQEAVAAAKDNKSLYCVLETVKSKNLLGKEQELLRYDSMISLQNIRVKTNNTIERTFRSKQVSSLVSGALLNTQYDGDITKVCEQ